jgi:hypothetical protein
VRSDRETRGQQDNLTWMRMPFYDADLVSHMGQYISAFK